MLPAKSEPWYWRDLSAWIKRAFRLALIFACVSAYMSFGMY
ncbi:hypothetical protein PRUB_a1015 [Pseudoalteromonas rubra]|uniref:Uncharacterized protein n=1 Tax=Pseudoalteromonas rubra TaxID=43658 RepID=A0A8T0C6Z5_9GAMM|nr:hypothetical protein PRUB_a1015 [Pseudoalteromonas rubra]